MKHIYVKLIFITLVSGLVSCSFLDESMRTKYSDEDIFGSEPALEAFVTGCYSTYAYRGAFHSGAHGEWFAPGSTIVHWGLSGTPLSDSQKRWVDLLSLAQFSRNPYNLSVYTGLYSAIYTCNKLIDGLKSSPVGERYKRQIESEARYLRAMSYFHIVRRWGNAPIHLDVPASIEHTNGKREDFWKIYALIIEDLNYSEENGRTYDEQFAIAGAGTGRVCKDAATALKSLVYLTIGTLLEHSDVNDNFWTCPNTDVFAGFAEMGIESAQDAFKKSLECAKLVIPQTNPASPYRLADNYAWLFR